MAYGLQFGGLLGKYAFVINKKDLLNIYSSGTGKLKLRGKVTFEPAKKRGEKDKLVISEIPYTMIGNNISKFLSDTVALIENKVTTDILDMWAKFPAVVFWRFTN
jgi:DNA gyrase subunit A